MGRRVANLAARTVPKSVRNVKSPLIPFLVVLYTSLPAGAEAVQAPRLGSARRLLRGRAATRGFPQRHPVWRDRSRARQVSRHGGLGASLVSEQCANMDGRPENKTPSPLITYPPLLPGRNHRNIVYQYRRLCVCRAACSFPFLPRRVCAFVSVRRYDRSAGIVADELD